MRSITLTVLLIWIPLSMAFAGGENQLMGARGKAMGATGLCSSGLWSLSYNPAAMTGLKTAVGGIYYEQRFGMKELGIKGVGFVLPLKRSAVGIAYSQFGYSEYKEQKAGLAYALSLNDKISAGVRLNYFQVAFSELYGTRHLLMAEAALLAHLSPKLDLGAHIFNPNQSKISDNSGERIPSALRIGLQYAFNDKVKCAAEVEKNSSEAPSLHAGISYHVVKPLYLRAGCSTAHIQYSFGFGVHYGSFWLDAAAAWHDVLGYTPALGLHYQPGQ